MRISLIILILVPFLCEGQEADRFSDQMRSELSIHLYSSKPEKGSNPEEDPAVMLSFEYPVVGGLCLGLGGGLQSPHFNTSLVPVFLQASYFPINGKHWFLRGRAGRLIPLHPREFKGGTVTELLIAYLLERKGKEQFVISVGYAHQRMTRLDQVNNWWWTDSRVDYRFNRLTIGFGVKI